MDLAERIVSQSESKHENNSKMVAEQMNNDSSNSISGVDIAERIVRKASSSSSAAAALPVMTSSSSSHGETGDKEYEKQQHQIMEDREHRLTHSNALLSSALLSNRPKKLVGEISSKTQQLLKELATILIQRVARGYICRRSLKIGRLVSIIKDQLSSSYALVITEEVILQHAFEIATAEIEFTEAVREVKMNFESFMNVIYSYFY